MANKKAAKQNGDQTNSEASLPLSEAGGAAEERLNQIAIAAFLRSASRNFVGGDPVEDWLLAEIEVDGRRIVP